MEFDRDLISNGNPMEGVVGFSRAVRAVPFNSIGGEDFLLRISRESALVVSAMPQIDQSDGPRSECRPRCGFPAVSQL